MELLPQIKKQWPDTEVIVLTGNATFDEAVEATKRGAYHFQTKPFDQKILLLSVERALEHRRLNQEASSLRKAVDDDVRGRIADFSKPVHEGGRAHRRTRRPQRCFHSDHRAKAARARKSSPI